MNRLLNSRQKVLLPLLFGVLLLSSCGTSETSDSTLQIDNASESAVSSNSDTKVPEPSSCPDYQDNYSVPYLYCDSGSDVVSIQQALVDLGYSVDVDGYYGPGTRSAVKKFQSSRGLSATGQVNSSTWSSLVGNSTLEPEYSDEAQTIYEAPTQPVNTQQRVIVNVVCDLRESGLSSSWYGQSYYWIYYNVWSDGTRTSAGMGQGYDPPYDCM